MNENAGKHPAFSLPTLVEVFPLSALSGGGGLSHAGAPFF